VRRLHRGGAVEERVHRGARGRRFRAGLRPVHARGGRRHARRDRESGQERTARAGGSPGGAGGAERRLLLARTRVDRPPEVLFVCLHNAGRSQMAAGLLKLRSRGRIRVASAGTAPGEQINPMAVEAMRELGVELGEELPKPLDRRSVERADVVITMGCGDACPVYPGKRYEEWQLDDPAGRDLTTVRRIRDEIDARVQKLVAELLAP